MRHLTTLPPAKWRPGPPLRGPPAKGRGWSQRGGGASGPARNCVTERKAELRFPACPASGSRRCASAGAHKGPGGARAAAPPHSTLPRCCGARGCRYPSAPPPPPRPRSPPPAPRSHGAEADTESEWGRGGWEGPSARGLGGVAAGPRLGGSRRPSLSPPGARPLSRRRCSQGSPEGAEGPRPVRGAAVPVGAAMRRRKGGSWAPRGCGALRRPEGPPPPPVSALNCRSQTA